MRIVEESSEEKEQSEAVYRIMRDTERKEKIS